MKYLPREVAYGKMVSMVKGAALVREALGAARSAVQRSKAKAAMPSISTKPAAKPAKPASKNAPAKAKAKPKAKPKAKAKGDKKR
jgi:hypothetical protein